MDEVLGDLLDALRGSQKEAVGGELVDETRGAAGVVVDEDLGILVEDVLGSVDGLDYDAVSVIGDRARIADIDLMAQGDMFSPTGKEKDYVSVWSMTMSKKSLGKFRMIFGLMIFFILVFGGAIAMIACFKGFHCRAGAEGVGRACTESFVISFITILAVDFCIGTLMSGLYIGLYGFKSLV